MLGELKLATRSGLEPPISALTGQYVKPTTPPGRVKLTGTNYVNYIEFKMLRISCQVMLAAQFSIGRETPRYFGQSGCLR